MKTLFISLLVAFSASASNVLIFSTNSTPVQGRAIRYLLSVDTPLYSGRADALINPVLPNVPLQWVKTNGAGGLVAMSAAESNSVLAASATATAAAIAERQVQAKVGATNALVVYFNSPEGRVQFAFMEATMDALNTIRGGLAGNTNMPLLTLTQLTNAIKVRINAQADNAP